MAGNIDQRQIGKQFRQVYIYTVTLCPEQSDDETLTTAPSAPALGIRAVLTEIVAKVRVSGGQHGYMTLRDKRCRLEARTFRLEARICRLDTRICRLETRTFGLETRICRLEARTFKLETRICRLETRDSM